MVLPTLVGVEGGVLLEVSMSMGSRYTSVQQLEQEKQAEVLQDLGRRVLRQWR